MTDYTKEDIEKEVGQTLEEFQKAKVFNEDSPLQYMNLIVADLMAQSADVKAKNRSMHDPRGFVAQATTLFQINWPKYRKIMERAGYTYEEVKA